MMNEKGSVLSISLVVIVILSLVLSMTTAYTFDVAQRTNVIVESNDEELFAKAMVRNVIHEIKETINNISKTTGNLYQLSNAEVDSIIAENEAIIQNYYMAKLNVTLEELNVTYPNGFIQIDLDEIWTSDTGSSLKYTVSYTRLNNSIISRSLLLELNATTGSSGTVVINDYSDIFNLFDIDHFDDENILDCTTNCRNDFIQDFYINPNKHWHASINNDVYIDQSFWLWHSQGANSTYLNLRGHIMVVNGNLELEDIHTLTSHGIDGEPNPGPGLLIVKGNLIINNNHGFTFDNVIILVQGYTLIDFSANANGNSGLTANNAHIISLNTYDGLFGIFDNQSSYYSYIKNYTFNEQPLNYRYVGSDANFPGINFIIEEFGDILDLGSFEFDFIESPFIIN